MTRCTRNIGKFGRIVAASALAAGLLPALVHAQKAEVSVFGGYTASEGIHASEDRIITAVTYNQLDITSGGSWGLTAGYYITPAFELEFLYNNQFSSFQAKGPAGTLKLADGVNNNYGPSFTTGVRHHIRPFFSAACHALSPASVGSGVRHWGHRQRRSLHLGRRRQGYAGAVGLKAWTRYTTYVRPAMRCLRDPHYFTGCFGNPDYANQFDISAGVTFRSALTELTSIGLVAARNSWCLSLGRADLHLP